MDLLYRSFMHRFLEGGALIALDSSRVLIAFGKRVKREGAPLWYIPDYFLTTPSPFVQFTEWTVIDKGELSRTLKKEADVLPELKWKYSCPEIFSSAISDAKRAFDDGTLKKVVPYIVEKVGYRLERSHLAHILINLLNNKEQHVYGVWGEGEGMVGATPEILFDLTDKIETMALAGTGRSEEIIHDPKERHEHQLVIEGMTEALSSFGEVVVGETSVMRLPQLFHLHTPIRVNCQRPPAFEKVAKALHPTPALGGLPQKESFAWLKHYNQQLPRGSFGAPFGCQFGTFSRSLVAIRNLQWTEEHLSIFAGCGIVSQSIPEKEWLECRAKAESVRASCGL